MAFCSPKDNRPHEEAISCSEKDEQHHLKEESKPRKPQNISAINGKITTETASEAELLWFLQSVIIYLRLPLWGKKCWEFFVTAFCLTSVWAVRKTRETIEKEIMYN